jgi:oligopeptide/dipeptide ABC transporter ATP-binding protein
MTNAPSEVLTVDDLTVTFTGRAGIHTPVDRLSFTLEAGKTLALVGESGSGKSLTAAALLGLLPNGAQRTVRTLRLAGRDIAMLSEREQRRMRGRDLGMVFQNPLLALNPSQRLGVQMTESYRLYSGVSARTARERAQELLATVDIPDAARWLESYPHQLSGGMRQRVLLAMAVMHHPKILIADEPTTALDVLVQAQILTLIQRLQKATGMATLFITHNLALAAEYADTVLVLYAGRRREYAPSAQFFQGPRHPYSRALLDCIPTLGHHPQALLEIPGKAPTSGTQGPGCAFAPRCGRATPECTLAPPPEIGDSHRYLCLHPLDPP